MRRHLAWGAALGLLALAAGGAALARLGLVAVDLPLGDGPWFWLASRAAGVTAYVALTLEVLLGLALSTAAADGWIARARTTALHRWLSALALGLAAAHALALLGDRYARFDALDVLVPFLAPWRPVAVGLGGVALYLAAAVHASFALRRRLGPRAWRAVHYLAFAVFALATAHGLLAGSDAGAGPMRALYLVAVGLVAALAARRARDALRGGGRRASATARAQATTAPVTR